jgi:hypothetical protein
MIQMPDPRASEAEKQTKEWYIPMADFVIDLAVSSSPRDMTRKCLNAANGVLDKKDYAYVMKTYAAANEAVDIETVLNSDKLGTLRDVDILTPIKDKYMGEFINSYHNYQVYSLDPKTIMKRNTIVGQKVTEMMFKKLQELLISQDGQSNVDVKGFIDKELENWKNEAVIKEQSALELLNTLIEAKRKYTDAYFYWWACEEVYTYRRLSGNDVLFEIIDPLEYYRVDSGNYFVEDDNYGLRRYTITLQEIIDKFYNNMDNGLTEKQLALIKRMMSENNSGVATVTSAIFLENKEMFPDNYQFAGDIRFTKKGLVTTVDHYVFKTEVKKGILKYMSPTGEASEMDVDASYILDTEHGDISIEWMYIDQFREGWRFGDRAFHIHIPPRLVELPRELISNTGVCKSPFNGVSYIHKNSARKPIPYRIKDNIALYKIYTLLEERWLNKFKSWLLTPESILSDSKEMSTEDRLQQADIDSIFPFNDANVAQNPNVVNYFKEVATMAVVEYVKILNQIKESIKQSAWELANMNDARFGQSSQYKGKAVTEYDYNQAIKGTVWSLEMFNSFREKDYMANLDFSRAAWIDGKQGSYVDPNTKEVIYADINGEDHLGANMGIFIANSAELNAQAQELKQLAFNSGQNGDTSVAAEAITNKNIAQLKQIIIKGNEATREFQLKIQTAKEEAMAKVKELEIQANQEKYAHEEALIDKEIAGRYEVAILDSETQIAINEARLEVDTNGNGYIDSIEADNNQMGVIAAKQKATDKLEERKRALETLKIGSANLKAQQMAKAKAASNSKK